MSVQQQVNPYQPPGEIPSDQAVDLDAEVSVEFESTQANRQHAIDQYLLHWHPHRLLWTSLLMIGASTLLFFRMAQYGSWSILVAGPAVGIVAGVIYRLLVRHSKRRIRQRLSDSGLDVDGPMTLNNDATEVRLVTPDQEFSWPNEQVKAYTSEVGLLLCPEPLMFVFVPKKSDFQTVDYKRFVTMIKSRTSQQHLRKLHAATD